MLGGFSESAVRGVVARTIGGDTRELARALWEVTSGNPLFVGEMLRHLQESGGLERVRRSNTLGSVADLGLPERIRDVIDRRLSRTSDQCHQVLALGAVIGREFEVTTVEPLADLPHDELLDTLDEACAAHLIEETPGHPGRFSFLHALIRETLYAELSPSRRRRLHQRVGEAMERLAERKPTPPLADLAYHFFKAMSAESADRAVDYATRAGDRAADALASEEAARFYAMALDALELSDGADLDTRRIDLHTRRARAFGAVAQWALEKEEVLLALQSVSAEQIERRAELLLMLADSSFYLLDVPGVRSFAEQALQLAEQVQRSDVAADALGWLARCDQADGDLARAMQTDRAAIRRGGGRKGVAIYHGPLTLYLAGATVDAVTAGQRAAELARTSGDTEFVIYALSHYGLSLGAAGRYREAKEIFEEVRRFGRRYGVLPPLARATAMQAGVHLAVYDLDGAETLQHEALELARSLAFTPTIVSASIDLLFTMARRHNPGSAGELLAQTTASVVRTPGWHEWLWTLRLTQARAELALAREEFGDAVAEATAAIHQSRARGRPKYEALGLLTRALARQRLNQTQDAIADAHRAVAVAGDTSDPALQLRALRVVLDLDGSDALALAARTHWDHIHAALPDESMRVAFATADALRAAR